MVKGIGNDIVAVSRIHASIQRHGDHFINKIFTPDEQLYCQRYRNPVPHFAGRFAAKEAVVKALGTGFRGGITWLDVAIHNDENGKPAVLLSPNASLVFNHPNLLVSISI